MTESTERYEFMDRIAVGGMAEVFLARATTASGHQREVAIKRLLPELSRDPRFVEMFIHEAHLAMRLSHPNVVRTYDAGTDGQAHYLVMELVDGLTLRGFMQRVVELGEPLPIQVALYIAREACSGLVYAHTRTLEDGRHLGIVHRDLSPPNILIGRDGAVKITDFGLSRALSHGRREVLSGVTGRHAYCAPEALGGDTVDQRSDVYSLGVCLWEMLAGRRLFLGSSEADTVARVRAAQAPKLRDLHPDVDSELEALVARAIALRPSDRFTTARELQERLSRALRELDLEDSASGLVSLVPSAQERAFGGTSETLSALISRELEVQRASNEEEEGQPLSGAAALTPSTVAPVTRARHDLSRFWSALESSGEPPTVDPLAERRGSTIDSMESAASPTTLPEMLEGKLAVTQESISLDSYSLHETPSAGERSRWFVIAILVLVCAASVFFWL